MTDLPGLGGAAGLGHQVRLEPPDCPAGPPGPDLTFLLRRLPLRGDGKCPAGDGALPHLALLPGTQSHGDSLTVGAQDRGQTEAPLSPADPLVVETAAVTSGLHTGTGRGGVQLVGQGVEGEVRVSPDPLHHLASTRGRTDSLQGLHTSRHGLVVFCLLNDDPTFLLILRVTILNSVSRLDISDRRLRSHLVLFGEKLRDVGGVADLLVVGEALQDGVGDGGGDLVHLVNTAVAGLSVHHTPSQVHTLRGRVHHHHGNL